MSLFATKEALPVEIVGLRLHCEICKHERFFDRKGQLNTAVASLFNLDWFDATARCLVCANCGYVHWFLPQTARE